MRIIETFNSYSYHLQEHEWYGKTIDENNELIAQCKGAAADRGARYANIFVQPAAVLSIAPTNVRHCVWKHTFPLPVEQQFKNECIALLREYYPELGADRMRGIAKEVFG